MDMNCQKEVDGIPASQLRTPHSAFFLMVQVSPLVNSTIWSYNLTDLVNGVYRLLAYTDRDQETFHPWSE